MIKKIAGFIKSLGFRVFITNVILCGLVAAILCATAYFVVLSNSKSSRISHAMEYAGDLSLKISTNAYLSNSAENPDITKEMKNAAEIYEGRILIIDSGFRCITDTYNTQSGRYIVSKEVISAIRGNSTDYTDNLRNKAELSIPIKASDADGNTEVKGCILFYISLQDDADGARNLLNNMILVCIPLAVLYILYSIFHAVHLSRPVNKMSNSLKHISEGYIEDKVKAEGFSELRNMAESVNMMLGRLSGLEASRQEFVSNVSHELKTPITSIKVLADSILSDPETPVEVYQEFMTDINNEIDRENQIINDLLALVKLDRKNGDMHIAAVEINEMLELLMKRIKPIAQTHNVELVLESYRKVLAEVDEVKLTLAVSNLIENAVKYNVDGGWVKVILDCDHKYFTITVRDSGIGIPEESLEMIFDRFYRVDKMRARQTGGTGLGLSIARSVVLMHHGTIKVDSKEGEGTTFYVKLPLTYIENEEVERRASVRKKRFGQRR